MCIFALLCSAVTSACAIASAVLCSVYFCSASLRVPTRRQVASGHRASGCLRGRANGDSGKGSRAAGVGKHTGQLARDGRTQTAPIYIFVQLAVYVHVYFVCSRVYLMYLSCLFACLFALLASTLYNTASTITSRSVQYAHNRISATIGYPLQ